ncbi:MAG: WD40 repeat domain-containing protein [Saprospiraceae bacterium]|nr:WD40 repeat domain-containing protein [Saprospiraceae bacterium]
MIYTAELNIVPPNALRGAFPKNELSFHAQGKATSARKPIAQRIWQLNAINLFNYLTITVIALLLATQRLYSQGHQGAVRQIAANSSGTKLATIGADKTIKIWNVPTLSVIKTIGPFNAKLNNIVFSPDNEWVAACGENGFARIWKLSDGTETKLKVDPFTNMNTIVFSPSSNKIAVGGAYSTWYLFSIMGEKEYATGPSHDISKAIKVYQTAAFNPDGKTLAFGTSKAVGLSEIRSVVVFDLTNFTEIASLPAFNDDQIDALCYSTDGQFLAAGSSYAQHLMIWEVKDRRLICIVPGHILNPLEVYYIPIVREGVSATHYFQWEPRNRRLTAATNKPGNFIGVTAWSAGDSWAGNLCDEISILTDFGRNYSENRENRLLTKVNGNIILGDENGVLTKVNKTDSKNGVTTIKLNSYYEISDLAFSPNGNFLACVTKGDGYVKVIDAINKKNFFDFYSQFRNYGKACFSQDNKLLAATAIAGTGTGIIVWEVANKQEQIRMFEFGQNFSIDGTSIFFSDDNRFLVANDKEKIVGVWEVANGKKNQALMDKLQKMGYAGFAPNGKYAIKYDGEEQISFWDWKKEILLKSIKTLGLQKSTYPVFSSNGKYLRFYTKTDVAANAHNLNLESWEVDEYPTQNPTIPEGLGHDGYFSTDVSGNSVAVWSRKRKETSVSMPKEIGAIDNSPIRNSFAIGCQGQIDLVDIDNLGIEHNFMGEIKKLVFSPDSKYLAIIGEDRAVHFWNTNTFEKTTSLRSYQGSIIDVGFTMDGKWVYARYKTEKISDTPLSENEKLRVWELNGWKELSEPPKAVIDLLSANAPQDAGKWQAVVKSSNATAFKESAKGDFLATSHEDGTIRIWNSKTTKEVFSYKGDQLATQLGFSPDGRFLATGGKGKSVQIWALNQPDPMLRLFSFREGNEWISISTVGDYLSSQNGVSYVQDDLPVKLGSKGLQQEAFKLQRANFNNQAYLDDFPKMVLLQPIPKVSSTERLELQMKVFSNSSINNDFIVLLNKERIPCNLDIKLECNCPITLRDGDNSINISVSNLAGKSNLLDTTIWYSPDFESRALLIYTTDYQDASKWEPLPTLHDDIQKLKTVLEVDYGYQVELLHNPNISLLTEKLQSYKSEKFGINDHLLILMAGHGVNDDGIGFFVLNESKGDLDNSHTPYFRYSAFIHDNVAKIKCNHTLLLLDVPYAESTLGGNVISDGIDPSTLVSTDYSISIAKALKQRPFCSFLGEAKVQNVAVNKSTLLQDFTNALVRSSKDQKPFVGFGEVVSYLAKHGSNRHLYTGHIQKQGTEANYLFMFNKNTEKK